MKIIDLEIIDLRFPTSLTNAGTDSIHKDPDYSAAYVILHTDGGVEGHGFTFTIGRGNEICTAADSQLRWLGPEKGAIHISMAAIVNAVWDLHAKRARKPLWKLLSDMTPREIVACIDFQYITDALTRDEAIEILDRRHGTRHERESILLRDGYPAYTTSAGWMGYSDDKVRLLCREALAEGFTHFKVKVGAEPADDERRVGLVRDEIGPDRRLMIDANQRWDVNEAIDRVRALARFDLWWIEEPTSPDDVLGHAAIARALAPIRVATGEHCQNRVMFKRRSCGGTAPSASVRSTAGYGDRRREREPRSDPRWPRSSASRCVRTPAASALRETGPAPVDVGLPPYLPSRGQDGRSRDGVRRSAARAFRRSRRR
jgi:L-fuconate dehydratase